VSIEPNHECEIYEIKYNGQEIYKEYYYKENLNWNFFVYFYILPTLTRPLNQSENLAQLISKIDFTADIDDEKEDKEKHENEKSDTAAAQASKDLDKDDTISARKFYQGIYEKIKYFRFLKLIRNRKKTTPTRFYFILDSH